MLSFVGQRLDMELLRAAGIEESLVKPVKQSRLYDCLVTVLGRGVTSLAVSDPSIVLTDRRVLGNRRSRR
jgi:hypothetical protein